MRVNALCAVAEGSNEKSCFMLLACLLQVFTVSRPALGRDLAIGGPCAKFTSHIQVFSFTFTCCILVGWLPTLSLASRFVIFSVRVHVVRSAHSAKRNNEMALTPKGERFCEIKLELS